MNMQAEPIRATAPERLQERQDAAHAEDPVQAQIEKIYKAGGQQLVLNSIADPYHELGKIYQMVLDGVPSADIGLRIQATVLSVVRAEATREPKFLTRQAD